MAGVKAQDRSRADWVWKETISQSNLTHPRPPFQLIAKELAKFSQRTRVDDRMQPVWSEVQSTVAVAKASGEAAEDRSALKNEDAVARVPDQAVGGGEPGRAASNYYSMAHRASVVGARAAMLLSSPSADIALWEIGCSRRLDDTKMATRSAQAAVRSHVDAW